MKIKRVFLYLKMQILLLSVIFNFGCNSQIKAEKITQHVIKPGIDLRVDSILQFSVMVTAIFEDSKGNYWFGSHGDGLCMYNGEHYIYYTANRGLPTGIEREFAPGPNWDNVNKINGGNQIQGIQEDRNGTIWVKTSDCMTKFNGKEFDAVKPIIKGDLSTTLSMAEWNEQPDYLWFGTGNPIGLYCIKDNELLFFTLPPDNISKRDGVSALYLDRNGIMWLGTMGHGTFRYDGKSFTRINKPSEIGISRSVFQDKSGKLWMTNNKFGLNYLQNDTLVNFINQYSITNKNRHIIETFGTSFQAINEDNLGNIWLGTFSNGLWRYDGQNLTHITEKDGLPGVTVKSIFKDSDGLLWFGIGEGSVYSFDGEFFERFDSR